MKSILRNAIAGSNADFVEIRVEDTAKVGISFSGEDLKKAQRTRDYGGYVRALIDGSWGFVSFNDPERLPEFVKAAEERARAAGQGDVRLADVPSVEETIELVIDPLDDPRKISLEEKVNLFKRFSSTILNSSDTIISSGVSYSEEDRRVYFANSDGTLIDSHGLWSAGGMSAIGRKDNVVQSIHSGFGTRNSWKEILESEKFLDVVSRDVLDLVEATPVTGGRYTVILDPRLAGVFIHEAFGHLSEADNVSDNPKLLSQMKIGTRFGQDHFSVLDCGNLHDQRGSFKYDDEGVPASMTY
ncbi:TldD/PmbA family protein, partial [bacterium]|nr:TldD/PmbA family protein [bacterium]